MLFCFVRFGLVSEYLNDFFRAPAVRSTRFVDEIVANATDTDTDTGCFVFIDWLIRENRYEWMTMYAHLLFVNGCEKTAEMYHVLAFASRFTISLHSPSFVRLRHTASSLKMLLLLRYAHISQVRKVITAHLLFSWELISNASERANERAHRNAKSNEPNFPLLLAKIITAAFTNQNKDTDVRTRTVGKCIHKNKLCHKNP